MTGKSCIVTGATAGIGKITATALAAQGAALIITGRNQQKTEETVNSIQIETGNESVQYLLADILFTNVLARRLADTDVTVNALHPGHVATDIWKTNFSLFGPALKWIIGKFALTPEQGADNSIFLASSPEVNGITGKYFVKREPVQSSPISNDEKVAQRLWEISECLTL